MSNPTVGSSRKMRSGSPARARANSTRCFCPPESWPNIRSLDPFETRRANDIAERKRTRIVTAHDLNMLTNAQHLRRPSDLQHHARSQSISSEARIAAEHPHFALGRRGQAHHQFDGGRFTRAVRPQQGNNLTASQLQRHAIECDHSVAVSLGRLVQRSGWHISLGTAISSGVVSIGSRTAFMFISRTCRVSLPQSSEDS